jgi:hypothetical protein
VAREILTTERQYVGHLRTLVQEILGPLREHARSPGALITPEAVRSIFADVEVILGYHAHFLADLEARLREGAWGPHGKLGDLFLRMTQFLKTYAAYVNHFRRSQIQLGELRRRTEFEQLLARLQRQPACQGRTVKDYLIMPIQRIPRYRLLLADLLRHTWPEHPDLADLQAALSRVEQLASSLDEAEQAAANLQKMIELARLLQGRCMEQLRLVQPHRRFVREGILHRLRSSKPSARPRPVLLILFNDLLLWVKPPSHSHSHSHSHSAEGGGGGVGAVEAAGGGGAELEVEQVDSLVTTSVREASEPALRARHALVICTSGSGAVTLLAASAEEKNSWFADLSRYILDASEKYFTLLQQKKRGDMSEADALADIESHFGLASSRSSASASSAASSSSSSSFPAPSLDLLKRGGGLMRSLLERVNVSRPSAASWSGGETGGGSSGSSRASTGGIATAASPAASAPTPSSSLTASGSAHTAASLRTSSPARARPPSLLLSLSSSSSSSSSPSGSLIAARAPTTTTTSSSSLSTPTPTSTPSSSPSSSITSGSVLARHRSPSMGSPGEPPTDAGPPAASLPAPPPPLDSASKLTSHHHRRAASMDLSPEDLRIRYKDRQTDARRGYGSHLAKDRDSIHHEQPQETDPGSED